MDASLPTTSGHSGAADNILSLRGLTTEFRGRHTRIRANDDLRLAIKRGSTLGIVGESGSGKSVMCRSILRLWPPSIDVHVSGIVEYEGRDLLRLSEEDMRRLRGTELRMVFQNPMTSLNPVWPIGDQVTEGLRLYGGLTKAAARKKAVEMLGRVGIPSPERRVDEYPYQWSGGMLQRAAIAMAMTGSPKLLFADEPTTALDVTIQDQILALLLELQERTGMTLVLVSHDLAVVAETCDRIAVMYGGRIVETAPTREIFSAPRHPYTVGLAAIDSAPLGRCSPQAHPGQPPDSRQARSRLPVRAALHLCLAGLRDDPRAFAARGPDHLTLAFPPERIGQAAA
jgi:ABC-type dipeptide/oligopeptide/nickel transport system ATPase component